MAVQFEKMFHYSTIFLDLDGHTVKQDVNLEDPEGLLIQSKYIFAESNLIICESYQ